jgi:hypothetical protein
MAESRRALAPGGGEGDTAWCWGSKCGYKVGDRGGLGGQVRLHKGGGGGEGEGEWEEEEKNQGEKKGSW